MFFKINFLVTRNETIVSCVFILATLKGVIKNVIEFTVQLVGKRSLFSFLLWRKKCIWQEESAPYLLHERIEVDAEENTLFSYYS